MSPHAAAPEGRLVIGVDFGTTFSGVAVVHSNSPEEIDIIKTWPGGNGITSEKVPSELSYGALQDKSNGTNSHTTSASLDCGPRWGFQLKPTDARIRCFKLFLDRNQRLPHFVSAPETAYQLKQAERNVKDATADFLSLLRQHTLDTLTKRYGEAFMQNVPIEYVLTVPAVWSDVAKDTTLSAAANAGMGTKDSIRLISEPEAAAVYTFHTLQPAYLSVGDNFLVCDAGGGTVDLIAYRITQLAPLRVEESVVGLGGLCGSAFLNYRFADHVRYKLGEERYKTLRERMPKSWQMGLKHFEEFVKRNYIEGDDTDISIPFPGLMDDDSVGLDCGFLTLSNQEVSAIFRPVIGQVLDLVTSQVTAIQSMGNKVRSIILVGGFGQSSHLYSKLKARFHVSPPPPYTLRPTHAIANSISLDIEVLQPLHAWTAVARGAAIRGLELSARESLVQSRRSRFHYGTSYATVFDPVLHPSEKKYWSPLWERWMIPDRMQWHIAKGQTLPPASSYPSRPSSSLSNMHTESLELQIRVQYTRNFRPSQSLIVEDELLACDADEAPDCIDCDEDIVKGVCKLKTDLSKVPKGLFTRLTTADGDVFDNLDFEIGIGAEEGRLVFELIVDGVGYGKIKVEFDD